MTNFFVDWPQSSMRMHAHLQQICHLDRSVAQWRDLQFASLLAFAEATEIIGDGFLVAGRDRGLLGGSYLTGGPVRIVAQLKL
jgi:hypothetical protein